MKFGIPSELSTCSAKNKDGGPSEYMYEIYEPATVEEGCTSLIAHSHRPCQALILLLTPEWLLTPLGVPWLPFWPESLCAHCVHCLPLSLMCFET